MLETQDQSNPLSRSKLIGRCIASCIFVIFTHLALSLVPRFFSAFSFLTQLAFSALLLLVLVGFGGWCRRTLLRVKASAPAVVFFNILFIWGFYVSVIRPAVSQLNDAVFNWGVVFLFIGLYSIITSDPGIVKNGSACSDQPMESAVSQVDNHDQELELLASGLGHESTQVVFVIWHIYCVCANIRTDEWINWKKYPEFQLVIPPQPGQSFTNIRFRNPYDKGIAQNVKEFLALRT